MLSSIARLHYAESVLAHAVIGAATALKRKAQRHINLPPCALPSKPLPERSETLKIQRGVSRTLQNRYLVNLASLINVEPKQSSSLFPVATSL
jgi:hypothetical protein